MSFAAHDLLTNYQPSAFSSATRRLPGVGVIGRMVRLWRLRAGERRAFAVFQERDLHDLGLSRWDVQRELAKPFWRG